MSSRSQSAFEAPDAVTRARLTLLVGLLCIVALTWPQLAQLLRTGGFGDTDDAARMVQVRDFLAGQGWFDLAQKRFAPPDGHPSHWTRVVDIVLAALIAGWSAALEPSAAETAGRATFTLVLLVLLLHASVRLARTLTGEDSVGPATASIALSGLTLSQFTWGRIDHHAPQLVVVLYAIEAALRSLETGQAWRSARVGLLAALSISINVETIGLIAVACAAGPCAWIWRGGDRGGLFALAGGLAAGLVGCGLLFIPQGEAARLACDAISPAFVSTGMIAAAGLVALGVLAPRLTGPGARLAAGAAAAIAVAAVSAWMNPHCLGNPYGAVDPLVQDMWQSLVGESQPLRKALREDFWPAFAMAGPFMLATAVACWAAAATDGEERLKWLTMLAAGAVGWVVVSIELRGVSQLAVTGVWASVFVYLRLRAGGRRLLAGAALIAMSPIAWVVVAPASAEKADRPWAACYEPATFADMARLPPGLVAGPVFLGSHIIAHTPHSAMAAPYHRMSPSIRAALDIFLADPDAARDLAAARHVRYVAMCFDKHSLGRITARAPDGLAARLDRGETVGWLAPVAHTGPLRVFEVRAPATP